MFPQSLCSNLDSFTEKYDTDVVISLSRNAPLAIGLLQMKFTTAQLMKDVLWIFAIRLHSKNKTCIPFMYLRFCCSNYYPQYASVLYGIPLIILSADRPLYKIDIFEIEQPTNLRF